MLEIRKGAEKETRVCDEGQLYLNNNSISNLLNYGMYMHSLLFCSFIVKGNKMENKVFV